MDENTTQGARGTKVKVLFQGLHMTYVISMLVYKFKICILDTLSHLVVCMLNINVLTINRLYIIYIMHSSPLSHKYEQRLLRSHFQNPSF